MTGEVSRQDGSKEHNMNIMEEKIQNGLRISEDAQHRANKARRSDSKSRPSGGSESTGIKFGSSADTRLAGYQQMGGKNTSESRDLVEEERKSFEGLHLLAHRLDRVRSGFFLCCFSPLLLSPAPTNFVVLETFRPPGGIVPNHRAPDAILYFFGTRNTLSHGCERSYRCFWDVPSATLRSFGRRVPEFRALRMQGAAFSLVRWLAPSA
ncbi:hypothetical protein DFH09DRAFT_1099781 [Mycena vulgaris]|nr:hypothetical protein DFH09DRAFT_1099781 [Mycena vulgaris]